ncbi:MAG TPA: ribonucleoside triphosphate reductase [Spirochaetia bacterium]|nr:ribonucleoside triphosphate reductase [Spirochaetales bacterium]HRY73648.1 ribonucleoside triphosphate reductase [Spirochaetia bacterium]
MADQAVFPEWKAFLGTGETGPVRYVAKRSGEVERYERSKIESAVSKAFQAVGELEAASREGRVEAVAALVESKLKALIAGRHPNSIPAIEEIQDLVEEALIEAGEARTAKAYILYRARREALRDSRRLMLDINTTMDGYLSQADWRVKENANVNYSLGGLILHNSGTITANYWLRNIYPEEVAEAHRNADFHLHDLSMFSGYCAGWSLRQLIAEGLGGVPDKISSKPARRLSTLVQQMVNFLGVLQNEWAGAQALSSFDTYLAPFVKKDAMSEFEVRQCVQSFLFGVNTPSRWGSQAPFTNVTLDWTCPPDLRDRPAVVGGEEMPFSYGDCQAEMDLVNKVFIELMIAGDSEGRGFQYPIPTYNVTKDFDWDSPNARLLFEMTAKYGTPYFQNFVSSDLDPSDVRSMCCRLQLDKRELRKRGGGLFGSDELTGSVGVVTVNMPRIGYLSKDRSEFYSRLDRLMDLAALSLTVKRKVITRLLDGGLFPYTKRYLGTFDNHFNTIGLVGMHECAKNFLGAAYGIETEEGRAFALEVLEHMRNRLQDYQEKTGELFNLEATPAESTSYRLAKHDKERWPDIIVSGEREPYYTNSSQLPVGRTDDIFEALDHQEELQARYTGGTVFHAFLGEAPEDWRAVRDLVKAVASNYRVPYYTISPTFSVCPVHGYLAGEHWSCPKCKAEREESIRREIAELEHRLAAKA